MLKKSRVLKETSVTRYLHSLFLTNKKYILSIDYIDFYHSICNLIFHNNVTMIAAYLYRRGYVLNELFVCQLLQLSEAGLSLSGSRCMATRIAILVKIQCRLTKFPSPQPPRLPVKKCWKMVKGWLGCGSF